MSDREPNDSLGLAESDPWAAASRLSKGHGNSGEGSALSLYAAGVALRTLEDLAGSEAALRSAIVRAEAEADSALRGDATLSLAATRAMAGDIDMAFELLADAETAPEPARTHALAERAGWTARMGDIAGAMEMFAEAESRLSDWNDLRWLAHLRNNRGLVRTYVGEYDSAERDLRSALEIYTTLDWKVSTSEAQHNLGFLLTRRGDIVEALGLFRESAAVHQRLGIDPGELPVDEAEALLLAGLSRQAAGIAAGVVGELEAKGVRSELAEAHLMYARAAAAAGAEKDAQRSASIAADMLADQGRDGWAARAELLGNPAAPGSDQRLRAMARRLADSGLVTAAIEALLMAAERSDPEAAESDLATAGRWIAALSTPPLPLVMLEASTAARLADRRGDLREASRHALRGISAAERCAVSVPSAEIRAHLGSRVDGLVDIGRRAALMSQRTDRIFLWVEAGRGTVLAPPPLTRSRDPATAAVREDLRALREEAAEGADPALARRIGDLERHAARLERARSGRIRYPSRVDLATYKSALDGRRGIHLFSNSGKLHGLVIGRRSRRTEPIDVDIFDGAIDQALMELLLALGNQSSLAPRVPLLDLGGPNVESETQVSVLCPPHRSFAAAWSMLKPFADTPIVVTPSARWYASTRRHAEHTGVGLVVGPRLRTSSLEEAAIRSTYDDHITVGSTVAEARHIFQTCHTVHIAAHATYRTDNPLLSTIELADGPLFVYDIGDLERTPSVFIVSACSAGAAGGQSGLLGLVGALLGLGTGTVVAPVVPVPDARPTVDLMSNLHGNLRAGLEPPVALYEARQQVDHPVGHAFQCFGR